MKIRHLKEANETKVKDVTDIDWDDLDSFLDPSSKGQVATAPQPNKAGPGAKPGAKNLPPLNKASAGKTAAAMSNVRMDPRAANMLGGLNLPDDAINAEPELPPAHATDGATATPVTADNVPAVISTALRANSSELGDPSTVNPEWHQVKNLPGYMSRQIRVLGRETFKPFTRTPIEDVTVIANLGGQGPNSNREIQAVTAWLKDNGTQLDDAKLDYGSTMPGYEAETISYTASGVRFLLVLDAMGHYIYAWPEQDSVNQVGHAGAPKQLKEGRKLRARISR